jgi:hypothetical protein
VLPLAESSQVNELVASLMGEIVDPSQPSG